MPSHPRARAGAALHVQGDCHFTLDAFFTHNMLGLAAAALALLVPCPDARALYGEHCCAQPPNATLPLDAAEDAARAHAIATLDGAYVPSRWLYVVNADADVHGTAMTLANVRTTAFTDKPDHKAIPHVHPLHLYDDLRAILATGVEPNVAWTDADGATHVAVIEAVAIVGRDACDEVVEAYAHDGVAPTNLTSLEHECAGAVDNRTLSVVLRNTTAAPIPPGARALQLFVDSHYTTVWEHYLSVAKYTAWVVAAVKCAVAAVTAAFELCIGIAVAKIYLRGLLLGVVADVGELIRDAFDGPSRLVNEIARRAEEFAELFANILISPFGSGLDDLAALLYYAFERCPPSPYGFFC